MTILDAMDDPRTFGRWFRGESWNAWRAFLTALFALPMTREQLKIYQTSTMRATPPREPCREGWLLTGRRAGKSCIAALISVYLTIFRDHAPHLGPGEIATGMVISPDRRQSRVIGRFERGFCREIPAIAPMVTNETKDALEFSNRCVLETMTASDKRLRGYTSHIIVNDEVCFLPQEDSAEPDREILIAERPCLASLPDSLLLSISSPHGQSGCMYNAFQAHYAKDGDAVLFWKASSLEMNPSLDPAIIAAAYELDPLVAEAEWGGNFRSDCERIFTSELLDRITDLDRPDVLPPDFSEEEVTR